jgi:hypothetical protein
MMALSRRETRFAKLPRLISGRVVGKPETTKNCGLERLIQKTDLSESRAHEPFSSRSHVTQDVSIKRWRSLVQTSVLT